jgi:dTDP-4-dehydrorhamnose reductase/dTDP-4-dehydrorhamnose 3,5-epimerase
VVSTGSTGGATGSTDRVTIERTAIPGLLVVRLDVRPDSRGWFEEVWQRERMTALGLPDFGPVQANLSWNAVRGTTRGIHAEPWDKLVTVASGSVFASWVDLREGDTFGTSLSRELEPGVAVYVPRGVGNSFQTLQDATAYAYLINRHWRPGVTYPAVRLDDPAVGIAWPIPLADAEISEKDLLNPVLADVEPVRQRRIAILGAHGQLGRALGEAFPDAAAVGLDELDLTDRAAVEAWTWHEFDVVLNAAAYTDVDGAQAGEGRVAAWATNAAAPALLARIATEHRLTLVHVSTDYVFDGSRAEHSEDEAMSPLGVYGQSKAAGDLAVATTARHYLLRTSWLVGDGPNFVRTMGDLARGGENPAVVDDQVGRLTFVHELAGAVRHLLDVAAPYGTYNVTNSGEALSWAAVAAEVFELAGRRRDDVRPVTTEEYADGRQVAPRPRSSALDLTKLRATGFEPEDQLAALRAYCAAEASRP